MSPNPEACEEELPFREGQLIKVCFHFNYSFLQIDSSNRTLVLINKVIPDYSFYRLLERKTQMDFTGANVEIAPGMCLVIWYQRSKLMMSGW